jgi:hypothetical protein
MAYNQAIVREMIVRAFGGVGSLANSVGQGESSRESQHLAAIEFWQVALDLEGEGALTSGDRSIAQSEIARHQAELEKLHPPTSTQTRAIAV